MSRGRNKTADPGIEGSGAGVSFLHSDDILVGKDVLELVTTAMYVDPLAIYREYVQNAADAVDEGRRQGLLTSSEQGKVTIDVEPNTRCVRIRDNGASVAWPRFVQCLTMLGASGKRGKHARGFRGVGRLAGLGYAQDLIFRARVAGDELVSELRWDCRLLREKLRYGGSDESGSVSELIRDITTVSRREDHNYPERFFEVELRGLIRLGRDNLLNPTAIAEYLSQVAPVPFAPEFSFSSDIVAALEKGVELGELDLRVSGVQGPIYKPHRNSFQITGRRSIPAEKIELIQVPSIEGGVAAIGWILHHSYEGAIPASSLVRGLRFRCGNLQIGDDAPLELLFPETRFNAWAIGEVHVVDPRIVPNARRDNFEQSAHFNNLLNHLSPVARGIARLCRESSRKRQLMRNFTLEEAHAWNRLAVIAQGALSPEESSNAADLIERGVGRMEKILKDEALASERSHLKDSVARIHEDFQQTTKDLARSSPLGHFPLPRREAYEHMLSLIYDCSTSQASARSLVDKILIRLQASI